MVSRFVVFFFQAEDGIRDLVRSRGLGDVYKRQVLALDDEELSAFRGQTVSMIFQEPALALDPVYTLSLIHI